MSKNVEFFQNFVAFSEYLNFMYEGRASLVHGQLSVKLGGWTVAAAAVK
jgi:hypothetical protein